MSHQKYVAKELTHFVGRSMKSEDERYAVLIAVLRSGLLSPRPSAPDEASMLEVHTDMLLSDESMYDSRVVCFCDIPLDDLDLHMSKFSRFGLSFQKEFLLPKGANPVFYIAEESLVTRPRDPRQVAREAQEKGSATMSEQVPRIAYFDDLLPLHHHLFMDLRQISETRLIDLGVGEPDSIGRLDFFHDVHIGSFLKPFRALRGDDDPKNYYMEREWRVAGNVRFSMDDVYRVILPSSYAKRLRDDVPDYYGQVHFVD